MLSKYVENFQRDGVTVICLDYIVRELYTIRNVFEETVQKFPEFKKHPSFEEINKTLQEGIEVNRYSCGGTSFIGGTPSAAHNEFVRLMRAIVMHFMMEKFFQPLLAEKFADDFAFRVEQVICRILIRPPGDSPSTESWHRDIAPGANREQGDITIGGWLNLDLESQYFSCVKGSHLTVENDLKKARNLGKKPKTGFVKFTKEEKKEFTAKKSLVEIPPGHLILFVEDLVHEVKKVEKSFTSLRQFFGWRITKSNESVIGTQHLMESIENQGVVTIKSGQIPPIWPQMYNANWQKRRDLFIREMLVDPEKNLIWKKRCYKSLKETGLPMYPEYLPFEKKLLLPGQEFEVINPRDRPFEELNVLTTPTEKISLFERLEGGGFKRKRSESIGY